MTDFMNLLTGSSSISIQEVLINVTLAMILSQVVYAVFVKFGNTFSSRRQFGKIFLLISACTTIIISIIQASLALSLGLVGALSIVRFRTAIKEPEELAYTFFAITLGIGCGANARGMTIVCALLVLAVIVIRGFFFRKELTLDTYNFSVSSPMLTITEISNLLSEKSIPHNLRRSDAYQGGTNAQFTVEFSSIKQLEEVTAILKSLDSQVSTSFISNATFT